jgi:hypothetical protein
MTCHSNNTTQRRRVLSPRRDEKDLNTKSNEKLMEIILNDNIMLKIMKNTKLKQQDTYSIKQEIKMCKEIINKRK